jgi:hypothetical protein
VKYIAYWEYEPKDLYKCMECDSKFNEELQKDPEKTRIKYGRVIEAYWLGMEPKGFTIVELENGEQMANIERLFWPYKRWSFVPLVESKVVKGVYRKWATEPTTQ